MNNHESISKEELESIVKEQLLSCTKEQKEIFIKYRVPLKQHKIIRNGKEENVFVVAIKGNECMYYEDVEEGFNLSTLSKDGKIVKHWCNQDELKHSLLRWL